MSWDHAFGLANLAAMAGWAVLILLPRWQRILDGLRYGLVGALALTYAGLVMVYFTSSGGGFDSIAAVRTLFASDPVLLAGWLHYLAFDLFVGIWTAEQADALGLSRWLQAPILVATFMFGPLGLVVFLLWKGAFGARTLLADGVKL
jgi:ABA DEFICIENT 4-like